MYGTQSANKVSENLYSGILRKINLFIYSIVKRKL